MIFMTSLIEYGFDHVLYCFSWQTDILYFLWKFTSFFSQNLLVHICSITLSFENIFGLYLWSHLSCMVFSSCSLSQRSIVRDSAFHFLDLLYHLLLLLCLGGTPAASRSCWARDGTRATAVTMPVSWPAEPWGNPCHFSFLSCVSLLWVLTFIISFLFVGLTFFPCSQLLRWLLGSLIF